MVRVVLKFVINLIFYAALGVAIALAVKHFTEYREFLPSENTIEQNCTGNCFHSAGFSTAADETVVLDTTGDWHVLRLSSNPPMFMAGTSNNGKAFGLVFTSQEEYPSLFMRFGPGCVDGKTYSVMVSVDGEYAVGQDYDAVCTPSNKDLAFTLGDFNLVRALMYGNRATFGVALKSGGIHSVGFSLNGSKAAILQAVLFARSGKQRVAPTERF